MSDQDQKKNQNQQRGRRPSRNQQRRPRRSSPGSRQTEDGGKTGRSRQQRPSRRKPQRPQEPAQAKQQPDEEKSRQSKRTAPGTSGPDHTCDMVMNGDVASLFVDLSAAAELSSKFRFNALGGSSIGAFSAAATAAAEKGRSSDTGGFKRLAALSEELGDADRHGRPKLFGLLRPDPATRTAASAVRNIVEGSASGSLIRFAVGAAKRKPLLSLLSALPGLALAALSIAFGSMPLLWLWAAVGLILAIALPPGIAAITTARNIEPAMMKNGFGFCSGRRDMTPWIGEELNRLAGRQPDGPPLTFGDLWGDTKDGSKQIDLQVTAADISRALPVKPPFDQLRSTRVEDIYYFKPEELKQFLPEAMVDYLQKHARRNAYFRKVKGYLPLPEPGDLPVAFAVRLAVGLPLVMSAIPLYRAQRIRARGKQRWVMRLSHITGASISGKQPLHRFDALLPDRPTFTVHCAPVGERSADPERRRKGIWVQNLISQSGPVLWAGFRSLMDFAAGMIHVSANWREGVMLSTPGFKERMAVVKLSPEHAGLAMSLTPEDCAHLSELGSSAGKQLASRYIETNRGPKSLTWDAHRWIRFRSVMAQLEHALVQYRKVWHDEEYDGPSYDHMIMRSEGEAPDAFRWVDIAQRNHALRVSNQLLSLIEKWQRDTFSLATGDLPEPQSQLRLLPKY